MDTRIKICGVNSPDIASAACEAGVNYIGLVFYSKSPRHVEPDEVSAIVENIAIGVCKVGLVVNPSDEYLDKILEHVPLDMIQLHGSESLERVSEIKSRYGLPVMKAVGVSSRADLQALNAYGMVADQILVDAKPPKGAVLPGGNGVSFDWNLISKRGWNAPWMLAGGLRADNVISAIQQTGAKQIDLSSSVESAPGVKDAGKIRELISVVRAA